MKLLSYLLIILSLVFLVSSCDSSDNCASDKDCSDGLVCSGGECKKEELKGVLEFQGISDGDFIDGYRYDENGTLDGVQMTLVAKVKNIKEGEEVSLKIDGKADSEVKQKVKSLEDGSLNVVFKEYSLDNGSNTLILSAKDINGKNIETSITVKVQELTLTILSPEEGTEFTDSDDKDPQKYYIQQDVKVKVEGLVSENNLMAKLILFDDNGPKYSYLAQPEDGMVVFENVDFRNGNWKLVASIDTRNGISVLSQEVNVVAETEGSCNVDIVAPMAENNLINQKFLNDNNLTDKNIPVKITSQCPAGFKVKFILNGSEVYSGELQEENGEVYAEANVVFPENEENDNNDSVLVVKVAQAFDGSSNLLGGEATQNYTVDTVAPVFAEVTSPEENAILNTENDLDGNAANGIQFWVKGKVTGSTSTLKIYINSVTDSIQEVQVYENAINENGDFDTSLLPDNQYTTIRMDGDVNIIFWVEDEHGNSSIFERHVKVFTSNPNELKLSFNDNNFLSTENNINFNLKDVPVKMSKYLEGTLSLVVTLNGEPYNYDTVININDPDNFSLINNFQLTDLADGRYVIYPKFKDLNDFTYRGVDGYLNVKTSQPEFSEFKVIQDINNDNILNMSEDANSTQSGFQSDITVKINNLYLDNLECNNTDKQIKVSLFKGNQSGALLAQSDNVACDNTAKFTNVTLPEGSYKLFLVVNDNFGNNSTMETQELRVDITPPNTDNLFLSLTANGENKILTDGTVLLAKHDEDRNEDGLQSVFKAYSDDAVKVRIKYDTVDLTEDVVNGVADFGVQMFDNGIVNVELMATDDVGNTSNKTISNIVVDTLIPQLELYSSITSVTDSDDEDANRTGIQRTVSIRNMANIEEGRVVYIQKSSTDASGNLTWSNISQFTKDSSDNKDIVVTLPLGDYKLRAKASDENNQEGYSNQIDMHVTSSNCSIISVKKGNTELVSGTNFFNDNDVNNGKVTLTVNYTSSCSVLGATSLKVKKSGAEILSVNINTSLSNTVEIPFSDGESVILAFEINSTPIGSASYFVNVDMTYPSVQRVSPSLENVIYVNASNPFIGLSGNENKIADLNAGMQGAQFSITVNVSGAKNGSVELFDNDGTNEISLGKIENISTDNIDVNFSGTLSDNNIHDLKFKVTDEAGNETTNLLYNATVDVTNPGNLANLGYDALSDTERRKADLLLSWDQSGTDDVSKYVIRYSKSLFAENEFENLTQGTYKEVVIDNPDLTAAEYQKLITSLTFHNTYTIGVRAYDEVGNASDVLITSTNNDLNLVNGAQNIQLEANGSGYTYNITGFKNVGDINDDGYDDFVIAQEFLNSYKGRITIFYGQADPNDIGSVTQIIDGSWTYQQFGTSIASGDFNGDGKTDLIVGSLYDGWYDCSKSLDCYTGIVTVYYNQGGGNQIDVNDKLNITDSYLKTESNIIEEQDTYGNTWGAGRLGDSVTLVGDFDNDGYDDILISETGALYNGNKGRAVILKGRADKTDIDLNNDANTIILKHNLGSNSGFGVSVAGLGNIDAQGSLDVAVGDNQNKKVFIYYLDTNTNGELDENSSNVVVLTGVNNNFGLSVLDKTDINGDGNPDLIVGSGAAQNVRAYYGGSRFDSNKAVDLTYSFTSSTSSTNYGAYIESGDFNKDGLDDIIVTGTNFMRIFLSKANRNGILTKADIELTKSNDGLGSQDSIFKPIAISVNDDNNDGKYNNDDIKDFIIINNSDRAFFVKY